MTEVHLTECSMMSFCRASCLCLCSQPSSSYRKCRTVLGSYEGLLWKKASVRFLLKSTMVVKYFAITWMISCTNSTRLRLWQTLRWSTCCLITGHMHFYCSRLRTEDREVARRKCQPVGTFICHIDDLDVSDSITVARASLGPWHSPLASDVL